MPTHAATPIIVTRKEVERLFLNQGAESAIHEAAQQGSPMEHAQAMARPAMAGSSPYQ